MTHEVVLTSSFPELCRGPVADGMRMLSSSLSFVINGPTWVRRRTKLYIDVVGLPYLATLLPGPGLVTVTVPTNLTPLVEAADWREACAELTRVLRAADHLVDVVETHLPAYGPFHHLLDEAERSGWESWSETAPATRRGTEVTVRRDTELRGTRVVVTARSARAAGAEHQVSFLLRDVGWVAAIGETARTVWTSPTTFELRSVVVAGTYWGPVVSFSVEDGLSITSIKRNGCRVET